MGYSKWTKVKILSTELIIIQCYISIPRENVRKPMVFWRFQGDIEMRHCTKWVKEKIWSNFFLEYALRIFLKFQIMVRPCKQKKWNNAYFQRGLAALQIGQVFPNNLVTNASFRYKRKAKKALEHFKHVMKICPNREHIGYVDNETVV